MKPHLIRQWWENATRRRMEADVRVHPDAGQVPSPTRYRAPARHSREALAQLRREAPTVPLPVQPQPDPDMAWIERSGLAELRRFRDYLAGRADDREYQAGELLDLAARDRLLIDTIDKLAARANLEADGPRVPLDDDHERGPVCYGCHTHQPGMRRCWNQLEGREVWLCARCHPSTDTVDDAGADGEEPEQVDEAKTGCAHPGCTATAPVIPGHSYWCPDHVGDILGNDEPNPVDELPEPLTAAPASGPAAVPQLQQRDTETIRLPWGKPAVLSDTLTDLERLDGVR